MREGMRLLVVVHDVKERAFSKGPSQKLHTDGEAAFNAYRKGERGKASEVRATGVEVGDFLGKGGERIGAAIKGAGWEYGEKDGVVFRRGGIGRITQKGLEVVAYAVTYALGTMVVAILKTRPKYKGAEKYAEFHFVAETGLPRFMDEVVGVFRPVGALAIADAVKAGEVRAGFGGGYRVVGGDAVLEAGDFYFGEGMP
jgi:hypothetical protein